jgi:hypothetical protein
MLAITTIIETVAKILRAHPLMVPNKPFDRKLAPQRFGTSTEELPEYASHKQT